MKLASPAVGKAMSGGGIGAFQWFKNRVAVAQDDGRFEEKRGVLGDVHGGSGVPGVRDRAGVAKAWDEVLEQLHKPHGRSVGPREQCGDPAKRGDRLAELDQAAEPVREQR